MQPAISHFVTVLLPYLFDVVGVDFEQLFELAEGDGLAHCDVVCVAEHEEVEHAGVEVQFGAELGEQFGQGQRGDVREQAVQL